MLDGDNEEDDDDGDDNEDDDGSDDDDSDNNGRGNCELKWLHMKILSQNNLTQFTVHSSFSHILVRPEGLLYFYIKSSCFY